MLWAAVCLGQRLIPCYAALQDSGCACCLQTRRAGRKGRFSLWPAPSPPRTSNGDRAPLQAMLGPGQTYQGTQVSSGHRGRNGGKRRCGWNSLCLPLSLVLVLDVINVTPPSDPVQAGACLRTEFGWKVSLSIPPLSERGTSVHWRFHCRQVNPGSLLGKQEKALQALRFPQAQHLDGCWYAQPAPRKEEQTKGICMAVLQFVAYCSEFKGNNQIRNGKHQPGLCFKAQG